MLLLLLNSLNQFQISYHMGHVPQFSSTFG